MTTGTWSPETLERLFLHYLFLFDLFPGRNLRERLQAVEKRNLRVDNKTSYGAAAVSLLRNHGIARLMAFVRDEVRAKVSQDDFLALAEAWEQGHDVPMSVTQRGDNCAGLLNLEWTGGKQTVNGFSIFAALIFEDYAGRMPLSVASPVFRTVGVKGPRELPGRGNNPVI